MPEEIERLLNGYYSCRARSETQGWIAETASEIVSLAKILPDESSWNLSERAYCPLCGDGAQSHEHGFTVPEGLSRHLLGLGNTRECRVFGVALSLARSYWRREFK